MIRIAGAGLAGLATAWELVQRGREVTVYDAAAPGAGSVSRYAGGMLSAFCEAEIAAQAVWFLSKGVQAVLIKGGHSSGETSVDHLFATTARHTFAAPRLDATRRGTGCTLATAIACGLADGNDLGLACKTAKKFIHDCFREAVAGFTDTGCPENQRLLQGPLDTDRTDELSIRIHEARQQV